MDECLVDHWLAAYISGQSFVELDELEKQRAQAREAEKETARKKEEEELEEERQA